jgi:hypothetical protein
VLNSCDSANANTVDRFSSTAATLTRRGIPAVVAMQHEISDQAAIAFSRGFYTAVAAQALNWGKWTYGCKQHLLASSYRQSAPCQETSSLENAVWHRKTHITYPFGCLVVQ